MSCGGSEECCLFCLFISGGERRRKNKVVHFLSIQHVFGLFGLVHIVQKGVEVR